MVEANADPAVVTARILRETREAGEARALERAAAGDEASVAAPPVQAVSVARPPAPADDPAGPQVYARTAQFGVAVALALLLVLILLRRCRRA